MLQNKYKGIKWIQNRWRTQPVSCCSNASKLLCDAQTLEPTGGHRDHKVTAVLRRTVCGPNLVCGRSGQWLLITAAIPGQTDRPRRQTGWAKQTEYLSRLSRHGLGRPRRCVFYMDLAKISAVSRKLVRYTQYRCGLIWQASCDRMDPLCRQRHLSSYRSRTLKLTLTLTLF